ncbi:integral membrane protein S linking to the trans Golgi network-domain-containing protein [Chlamydoabsidia padenii]|nr:integral membrane protein S linking to the trans Golgi network-domain-containing protein [Chlamydoabsidia padenii]
MSSSFRITAWDPILIIAQIFSLQAIYYTTLSILLWVTLSLSGMAFTLDAIFQTTLLQTDNVFGWTMGLVLIVNAFVSIPLLVVIVQRAKLVLDFVVTLHGFHLVGCWLHGHRFPSTPTWWLVHFGAVLVMTLGGEWACMRYEMKPIILNSMSDKDVADQNGKATSKDSLESGLYTEIYPRDDSNHFEIDPTSSSSILGGAAKKSKRKTSDAERDRQRQTNEEEGSLTAIVGRAKQNILSKSQAWTSSSQDNKEYESIPMNSVDNR